MIGTKEPARSPLSEIGWGTPGPESCRSFHVFLGSRPLPHAKHSFGAGAEMQFIGSGSLGRWGLYQISALGTPAPGKGVQEPIHPTWRRGWPRLSGICSLSHILPL